MLRRFTPADWAAGSATAIGLIALYVPWYTYATGSSTVTVNGFRASVLGDLYFLTIAATALLLLIRHGFLDDLIGRRFSEQQAFAALAAGALAAVLLQVIVSAITGRMFGPGILLALIAAIVLAFGAWNRRIDLRESLTKGRLTD
jgi:hypothetical protein